MTTARSHGASSKPFISHSCCIRSKSVCQIIFDWQMSSGANDQANVLQYAAFRGHGWGHGAAYPSWPHVLITKLSQPSHNCIIPTVKELSVILWRKIGALIYDLHHVFQNFKSNAPLQRFAWCIAGLVLQILKPSLNCHLANSLIRKMLIIF